MMVRRRVLVIAMACLAVTVAVWAGVVLSPTLVEEWYLHRLRTGSEADRKAAEEKLLEMNSPGLIPVLLTRHFAAAKSYHSPMPHWGALIWRPGPMEQHRDDWEKLLKILCGNARGALPMLSRLMREPEEDVHEALVELLADAGPGAGAAFPVLLEVMRESQALRVPAALALKKVGAPPELVLPVLEEILRKEQDPLSRLRAIEALRFLGRYASPAAPLLVDLLGDENQQLRFNADHALSRMGDSCLAALIDGLRSPSARIREGSAQNLADLGPRAGGAVPGLEQCLSDPNEGVRRAAAGALARVHER